MDETLFDHVSFPMRILHISQLVWQSTPFPFWALKVFSALLQYLQDTLGDFIRTILETTDDCEVDPTRVTNNTVLQRQQTNLVMYCEMVWFKIMNSSCFFPR